MKNLCILSTLMLTGFINACEFPMACLKKTQRYSEECMEPGIGGGSAISCLGLAARCCPNPASQDLNSADITASIAHSMEEEAYPYVNAFGEYAPWIGVTLYFAPMACYAFSTCALKAHACCKGTNDAEDEKND